MKSRHVAKAILAVAAFALAGCHDVHVSCGDVNTTESNLGILNEPKFTNGMLLRLNNTSKLVERIYTLSLTTSQLSIATPIVDTTSVMSKSDFSMTFSTDIPTTEQSSIQSYINSNTQFVLGNSSRQDVRDPLGALNGDPQAKTPAKQVPSSEVMLFVSGEVTGDSISIGVQGQSGVKGDVKIVKIGNFQVNVTYDCEGSVNQTAKKGAPLLWKGLQVAFDSPSNSFTLGNKMYNLKDYGFGPALTMGKAPPRMDHKLPGQTSLSSRAFSLTEPYLFSVAK
jgi:hypothetical protein